MRSEVKVPTELTWKKLKQGCYSCGLLNFNLFPSLLSWKLDSLPLRSLNISNLPCARNQTGCAERLLLGDFTQATSGMWTRAVVLGASNSAFCLWLTFCSIPFSFN